MISVVQLVLLTAQLTLVGNAISVRNAIAEEFRGNYSFTFPDGEKAELIGVVENGIASIGTGTGCARVIELRCMASTVNIPRDLRFIRREGLVMLLSTPEHQKRILLVCPQNPWVIQGEFSRAWPN